MNTETMNRKDFLKRMGFSAGAILATYCFGGLTTSCQSDNIGPSGIDFTLDLTQTDYSALQNVGGYVKVNNVVIAQVATDDYVAVTQICSHEGEKQVYYRANKNDFYCSAHGAEFDLNGKGLNNNGKRGIKVYTTELNGNELRVFG